MSLPSQPPPEQPSTQQQQQPDVYDDSPEAYIARRDAWLAAKPVQEAS